MKSIIGTERNVRRKIEKLEEKGFLEKNIKHKKDKKGGTYLYIRPTELLETLTDFEYAQNPDFMHMDNSVQEGWTKLSRRGGQFCPAKDPLNIDPLLTYNKQQGGTIKTKSIDKIVDVVLNKKNIFKGNPIYKHIKNIVINFKNITNKFPTEKDILDALDLLRNIEGKKLSLEKREKLIIKTISELQSQNNNTKVNSINYFPAIINKFKEIPVFKLDNKLY